MGLGSLRRYHRPVDAAAVPDLKPGSLASQGATAADAEAVNAAKLGDELGTQQKLAKADDADSVYPVVREDSNLTKAAQADPTVGEGVAGDEGVDEAEPGSEPVEPVANESSEAKAPSAPKAKAAAKATATK